MSKEQISFALQRRDKSRDRRITKVRACKNSEFDFIISPRVRQQRGGNFVKASTQVECRFTSFTHKR